LTGYIWSPKLVLEEFLEDFWVSNRDGIVNTMAYFKTPTLLLTKPPIKSHQYLI